MEHIPNDFMCDQTCMSRLSNISHKVTDDIMSQEKMDLIYKDYTSLFQSEMLEKLSHKTVVINGSDHYNYKKRDKPWWHERLGELWKNVRKTKTLCLKSKDNKDLHTDYLNDRKTFDSEVQKRKRTYWHKSQDDLLALEGDQREFWKHMLLNKVGMAAYPTGCV